ncbi:hypothetical protein FKM82_007075 [Ascaphus truei]
MKSPRRFQSEGSTGPVQQYILGILSPQKGEPAISSSSYRVEAGDSSTPCSRLDFSCISALLNNWGTPTSFIWEASWR